jgi:hypothetical protein
MRLRGKRVGEDKTVIVAAADRVVNALAAGPPAGYNRRVS